MIKKILVLFLIWRTFLFFIAYISPKLIGEFGARFPYAEDRLIASGLPHWVWSFGNFDGVHYLGIARDGYAYQYTQAFFPLYPILIKIFSIVTFGNLIISALIISNIAFLLGIILFYKMIAISHNKKIAFWSCLFLLTFPTSFYFGSVYTEGLFFLMIISTFYLAEKKRIIEASLIGVFASATRLIGVFLIAAIPLRLKSQSLLLILLFPLGLVIYMVYLGVKFDNPFYFLSAQSVWGQERSTTQVVLLPQVFWRYLKILATVRGLPLANAAFEFSATVFAICFLLAAMKKVKLNWLVFSWLAILTPTLTGTLASMPRYILIAFPIYITLAQIKNNPTKILILIIFTTILAVATVFFTQGYWVA